MTAAAEFGPTQRFSTAPLDAAAEYLRGRLARLLPLYVLAMAPHAVAVVMLIDAVCGEQRDRAAEACAYLTAAMVWRWAGLALVQRQVLADMRISMSASFWGRLPVILMVRLACNVAVTWGAFALLVPTFYGGFLGSFAAPLMLENRQPALARVRQGLVGIRHCARRLSRIVAAMVLLWSWLLIALFALQAFMEREALPTLTGMNTSDLAITLRGSAWMLGVFYAAFVLLDFYWTVAAVFVFYQSQSGRLATDLQAQMAEFTEQAR